MGDAFFKLGSWIVTGLLMGLFERFPNPGRQSLLIYFSVKNKMPIGYVGVCFSGIPVIPAKLYIPAEFKSPRII